MEDPHLNYMKTNKKLFLASFTAFVVDKLVEFVGTPANSKRVAFIPTGADPYDDKWFVEKDRSALSEAGFDITEVDIKNISATDLYDKLSAFDLIVVSGGNSFYILEQALKCDFKEVLEKLLDRGVVYVGGSAGASLVGPDLSFAKTLDNPQMAPGLKFYKALGIVDFEVLPHFGEIKYQDRYEKILEEYSDAAYEIIPLTNYQAIEVVGTDYKIVETKTHEA